MKDNEREFVRDMKVLITKFEYETDKDTKMDLIDRILYKVRDFENEYCD